ncbi:hypothetical protein EON82_11040 [bacterium]|nr:MAG: hypothetical protein EON82_11040 [bacterium]
MSEVHEPDGYVVRFNVRELWKLRGLCLLGLLFCVGGFFFALQERDPQGLKLVLRPFVILTAPIGMVGVLWLFSATFAWARRPALEVSEDGVVVGFKLRKSFLVPWSDIEGISRSVVQLSGDDECLAIVLRKDAEANRSFGLPVDGQTGGPALIVKMGLLDLDWEEFENEVESTRPLTEDERRELLELAKEVKKTVRGQLTHDGDLFTLEDYRRVFRKAPVGSWSDSVYDVTPGDNFASFCADGRGSCGNGTNMMLGGMRAIQWRETGEEFCIEVRAGHHDALWHSVRYSFAEKDEKVTISFDAWGFGEENEVDDTEEDASDDWKDSLFFAMTYGGPC